MGADAAFDLRRQAEAAKRLMASLREQGEADDAEIVETAVEGETGFHEAVSAVIDEIDNDEILITGGKAKIEDIKARIAAAEHRNEMRRAALEQAFVTAEVEKIALPSATVFISKRAPGLIVDSEADIPSEFFKVPDIPAPRLDKRELAAALKAGREVAGAHLDNGSISLSLRRK